MAPEIRAAMEKFRAEGKAARITVAELAERYNAVTAGPALTANQFGRLLAKHGITSTPDKGKRWYRVLDARGEYLSGWREVFGALDAAEPVAASVTYAPGTVLRVTEDVSLEVISVPGPVATPDASEKPGSGNPARQGSELSGPAWEAERERRRQEREKRTKVTASGTRPALKDAAALESGPARAEAPKPARKGRRVQVRAA